MRLQSRSSSLLSSSSSTSSSHNNNNNNSSSMSNLMLSLGITIISSSLLLLLNSVPVDSFVVPAQQRSLLLAQSHHATNGLSLFPSALILADGDIPVDAAFTDEVDILGDPTIRLLLGGFVFIMVLLVVAKNVLGQMDSAIEKVLIDFESTMKANHASRWTNIEKRLEGCQTEDERAQKLFTIMEKLQSEEPEFMSRLNDEMAARQ